MKIILLFIVQAAVFIILCLRSKKPVRNTAAGFLTGGLSLLGAHLINPLIQINIFTLSMSMLSGISFPLFLLTVFNS